MLYAIISDIHSDIYKLEKVINYIYKFKNINIICLGDIIGYGDYPAETLKLISSQNILCLKGNH